MNADKLLNVMSRLLDLYEKEKSAPTGSTVKAEQRINLHPQHTTNVTPMSIREGSLVRDSEGMIGTVFAQYGKMCLVNFPGTGGCYSLRSPENLEIIGSGREF